MEQKVCPLLFIPLIQEGAEGLAFCREEKCAWWIQLDVGIPLQRKPRGECSINIIGTSLLRTKTK